MSKLLKTAVLLIIISVAVSCTSTEKANVDSSTADSLRKDSLAQAIIRVKDSIARTTAEKTASTDCDTTLIDEIIKTFK
ncbi:MAG: hypothetical protein J6T70_13325 [Bacteroidales bacterium]|nr:hypothetical protein [Bacteroidales bacterium]